MSERTSSPSRASTFARTTPSVADRMTTSCRDSGRSTETDDGQVADSIDVRDGGLEPVAHTSPRRVGGRLPAERVTLADFQPHSFAGGSSARQDFERGGSTEALVRPVRRVPGDVRGHRAVHLLNAEWDEDAAQVLLLEGAEEALDDGDAAVLAQRAPARTHLVPPAPRPVRGAGELTALVADEVLRRAGGGDSVAQPIFETPV